ncbi:RNA-directed DNA polymerase from mobile element jockey [Eumeta japonica]|uniref:RNA-directed DNA polymerase from mobile element jockey n=1 Tax=Eumeta variegata TaxID=151549 RepID=A0A4C1SY61_EUMVA|nr:RNA-directed DNA polymerase from mobile element jockey [Eumeta japonica]
MQHRKPNFYGEPLETLKRPVEFKSPNLSGGWGRSDCAKDNLFADHVFTPNVCTDIIGLSSIVSLPPTPMAFEFREVQNVIADLNPKKTLGIDGISKKIELLLEAVKILLFIFNAMMRLDYFPYYWKMIPKPDKDLTKKPRVQVGMDRYITVVKRGRSPKSSKVSSVPKISRDKDADSINSHNRFSLLKDKNDEVTVTTKSSKPPQYIWGKNSNALVKKLISAIGEGTFYVIPIKRGNIDETKIQVNTETDYRKITAELDKDKKDYYTYQLKSAKGMQIVLKGIDSCVDP